MQTVPGSRCEGARCLRTEERSAALWRAKRFPEPRQPSSDPSRPCSRHGTARRNGSDPAWAAWRRRLRLCCRAPRSAPRPGAAPSTARGQLVGSAAVGMAVRRKRWKRLAGKFLPLRQEFPRRSGSPEPAELSLYLATAFPARAHSAARLAASASPCRARCAGSALLPSFRPAHRWGRALRFVSAAFWHRTAPRPPPPPRLLPARCAAPLVPNAVSESSIASQRGQTNPSWLADPVSHRHTHDPSGLEEAGI